MAYTQWTQLTTQLVNKLKTLKVWNISVNKKEISVRCPFCGDSYKNAKSSHLYIKLDVSDGEPHTYYCQRCKAKGIVNADLLKQMKIYDSELNVAIGTNLKNISLKKGNKKIKSLNKSDILLPDILNDDFSRYKLKYINDRLGIDLKLNDLSKFKIFLHLYDVLDFNNIDFLTCKEGMGDILDEHFMGFLSYDNNYAIMRNTSKNILPDTRYYNYNLLSNYDNSKRFYVIPTKLDIMQDSIDVCITEGIFDILGVYHHIIPKEKRDSTLFVAVCGIGYQNVLYEIARMGYLNLNITFYSDADQDIRMFKKIKSEFPFLNDTKCEVIYNTLEKDYGVPKNRIKLKKSYI